jgi:hypothetical protein
VESSRMVGKLPPHTSNDQMKEQHTQTSICLNKQEQDICGKQHAPAPTSSSSEVLCTARRSASPAQYGAESDDSAASSSSLSGCLGGAPPSSALIDEWKNPAMKLSHSLSSLASSHPAGQRRLRISPSSIASLQTDSHCAGAKCLVLIAAPGSIQL